MRKLSPREYREVLYEREVYRSRIYAPPTRKQLNLYRKPGCGFNQQLYRQPENTKRLAPRKYKPKIKPRQGYLADYVTRTTVAFANDNGGEWYVSYAGYQVAILERLFYEEKAPSMLYEVVGGIFAHPLLEDEGIVFIQLSRLDALVEVCLEDLRVSLQGQVSLADVLAAGGESVFQFRPQAS